MLTRCTATMCARKCQETHLAIALASNDRPSSGIDM